MPRAWRITKTKHADSALEGEGARLFGGRWSNPVTRVVYAAESLSLAVLEVLVHLQHTPTLSAYCVFTIDFPDECLIATSSYPKNWRVYPTSSENQLLGDRWVAAGTSLALRVPSAVTVVEFNYLINPAHADFAKAKVNGPLPLDIDPRAMSR